MNLDQEQIAIVGLGYVGLPLAVEFGKKRKTIGFDVSEARIAELNAGQDATLEVDREEIKNAPHLSFSSSHEDLKECGVFIVAVPTPIDRANRPDLTLLKSASETVGKVISRGSVVIFESTVFPGCTREVCVPIIEQVSGLVFNQDFFAGYSPERINPGDKHHRLPNIVKVTSGSTPQAAAAIDKLYSDIIDAGTHLAASIEVAEAAKVIENTQRDLNIALMNELAIIFHKLDLDTLEVLAASATKWNFIPFKPGLVGGHCIGVDPYYLTYRAQEVGYHPEVILAGRRINDGMASHVADRVAKQMMKKGIPVVGSNILILGLAFKENCPDVRNSKTVELIKELEDYNAEVHVYDPWVDPKAVRRDLGISVLADEPCRAEFDAVVVTVGHQQFTAMSPEQIRGFGKDGSVFFDVKGVFEKSASDGRL